MAAQDGQGHVAGLTTSLSTDLQSRLFEEVDRVERASKRLSLPVGCKCGSKIPLYCSQCGEKLPNKSHFRNSFHSVNLNECDSNPICEEVHSDQNENTAHRGIRFWSVILAVIFVGLIAALETTIVGTALPTIIHELGGAEWYIWTVNGYFLTRYDATNAQSISGLHLSSAWFSSRSVARQQTYLVDDI
jgi:hypothetical protein